MFLSKYESVIFNVFIYFKTYAFTTMYDHIVLTRRQTEGRDIA